MVRLSAVGRERELEIIFSTDQALSQDPRVTLHMKTCILKISPQLIVPNDLGNIQVQLWVFLAVPEIPYLRLSRRTVVDRDCIFKLI